MMPRRSRLGILQAAAQRILQIDRPSVLVQEVTEGLVRQFLKRHHAVARKQVEGVPGLQIELHALALGGPVLAASSLDRFLLLIPLSRRALSAADDLQSGCTRCLRLL